MTLLKSKRQMVIIEGNDKSSDDISIKSEIKSEDESNKVSDINSELEDEHSDSEDNEENENQQESNAGWADSVAKILRTKKPKNKRTLVLSKAKKLSDVTPKDKPTDIGFQIEGEVKEEKPDPDILDKIKNECEEPLKKKKKEISTVRVKPNILDKDRERTLSKIATRGVVQLFNAVRVQQKDIDTRLQEAGPLERKREKAMQNIDKRAFLDVLMQKKSERVDEEIKDEAVNENTKKEKTDSTWNVLRDDFMMGAKMKDWDKVVQEDSDNEVDELSESD